MSNLRLINETSISSSVSSISITDVFSSDFDIYQITATGLSTTGTDYTEVCLRYINSSGSVVTTSDYDYAIEQQLTWSGTSELKAQNQDNVRRAFAESTDQAPEVASSNLWIFNPYSSSTFTLLGTEGTNYYGGSYNSQIKGYAWLKSLSSITGFQAFENNGSRPLASGTFRTYGLRRD